VTVALEGLRGDDGEEPGQAGGGAGDDGGQPAGRAQRDVAGLRPAAKVMGASASHAPKGERRGVKPSPRWANFCPSFAEGGAIR
jgi:hypothetical protein